MADETEFDLSEIDDDRLPVFRSLHPQDQLFCQLVITENTLTEAARKAFPESEKPSNVAWRRRQRKDINAAIEELLQEQRERHGFNVDTAHAMLIEDRDFARANDNPSAAVAATTALAKLHGLYEEKARVRVTRGYEEMTDEELAEIARGAGDGSSGDAETPEGESEPDRLH